MGQLRASNNFFFLFLHFFASGVSHRQSDLHPQSSELKLVYFRASFVPTRKASWKASSKSASAVQRHPVRKSQQRPHGVVQVCNYDFDKVLFFGLVNFLSKNNFFFS